MGVNQVLLGAVKIMDISDATVTADKLLSGATAYDKAGDKIEGSIRDNGSVSATFDGIDTKSVTIPSGYTSGGTVSLDDTIDTEVDTQADLISQIATALEGKAAGSGGGEYALGTFRVNGYNFTSTIPYSLPFIIGMTWRDYENSALCYSHLLIGNQPSKLFDSPPYVKFALELTHTVTIDGTVSGAVNLDDLIQDGVTYESCVLPSDNPFID